MAQTTIHRTKIELSGKNAVTYVERTAIFGLLRWWEKISTKKLGNDFSIETDVEIESIYINGKPLSAGIIENK